MFKMIERLYLSIFFGKTQKVLLTIVLAIFFFSLYNRYIQSDENWLGEQAFWLVNEGTVKLKSIPFILNWDQEFLVYHKLPVWIGAAMITVFGWSVYYFKTITLLFFIFSLYLLHKILKQYTNVSVAILGTLLMVTVPLMFLRAFEFRPEVFVMTFGLASFYFLKKGIADNHVKYALLAGLMAAAAFLSHLNGVIFCLSGFFFLLYLKKIRLLFFYSLIGISFSSIYFIPLILEGQLVTWVENLKNWPSHSFDEQVQGGLMGLLIEFVMKLVTEHKRFFWGEEVIGISALFITSLIIKGKYLWKEHKDICIYSLFNIFFLAILGSHKASRYLLFYLPFMVIIISLVLYSIRYESRANIFKPILILLLITELVFFTKEVVKTLLNNTNHVDTNAYIAEHLKEGSTVIAPWEFIYNEIDNFKIYSYKSFEYLEENPAVRFEQLEFFERANNMSVEFIIINERMKNDNVYHWFENWNIEPNPYYEIYKSLDGFLILANKSRNEN